MDVSSYPSPPNYRMYWPVLQRSSGLMRRLVMDNNDKVSSRAKPHTIEVRKLQHDPVASLSGGKFCKAPMDSPHTIHNKSQAPIGNGNTKQQKKTAFLFDHAILRTNKTRLCHSSMMFMCRFLWIARSIRHTGTHTHKWAQWTHLWKAQHSIPTDATAMSQALMLEL